MSPPDLPDSNDTNQKNEHIDYAVSDNFLENGILQVDSKMRQFLAFCREHEELSFIAAESTIKGIYRKSSSFVLTPDLGLLCRRLQLQVGDILQFFRQATQPRCIQVVFPRDPDFIKTVLFNTDFWRTKSLNVDFPLLEKKPTVSLPPLSKIINSVSQNQALDYLRNFFLTEQIFKSELISLNRAVNLHRYDHQIRAVKKTILECQGRALLADEVGLGKTIEAGLILREYFERGEIKKALIVVPASLSEQWRAELSEKFALNFQVIESSSQIEEYPLSIISIDTAKSLKLRHLFSQIRFDIVIVDEAHKLKNRKTLNYQFVKNLSARYLLLLTATPIQNDLIELFNLMNLISPGCLGTLQKFRREHISAGNRKLPSNVEVLKSKLGTRMIRNTRLRTNLSLPPRRVVMQKVELPKLERMVYERVSSFVRENYYLLSQRSKAFNQLTLMLFQKLLTSSPRALAESIRHVLERGGLEPWLESFFRDTVLLCEQIEVPAKFSLVADLINTQLSSERVLIFTQFLVTQRHLCEFLKEQTGRRVLLFYGEMSISKKEEVIKEFYKNPQSIMISTDSGAEGRNLQFARYLINFDFPWNPMKVEQRIGRIHRLGQERETLIINLCSALTIEEHIVELLLHKIRLFERVVGELDMILGYLATEFTDLEVMDKKIMEIIVKYQTFSEQGKQVELIASKFEKAAKTFEEVLKRQEYIFG